MQLPPFPPHVDSGRRSGRTSIIVTNYNYALYLGQAVQSALAQTDVEVEVVVVDDGSTDGSKEILASFGPAIKAVMQDNGGQNSAFNAGFAASTGSMVIFLDADDMLRPDIAAAVSDAVKNEPDLARVVFRLQAVDEVGEPLHLLVPPAGLPLPSGDVRAEVLRSADDVVWPPTTGNAFPAWVLAELLPLPVDDEPTGADMYLHPLSPLLGTVVALDRVGGSYRMHQRNAHYRGRTDTARSRFVLEISGRVHRRLDETAAALGLGRARPRSVALAAHRLVSLRLEPALHPVPGDTRMRALTAGLVAAAYRRDVGPVARAIYGCWMLVAAVAPRRAVSPLAEAFFLPELRPSFLRRVRRRARKAA